MKTVSVVIPCYNARRWVSEAVASCLAQTYQNIEVVVVDDGSTDGSQESLRALGDSIRLETGSHHGGNHARNLGFVLSRGDFIQFLDADDYLLPEKIERQVAFLEQTGADVVYGDWRHRYDCEDGSSWYGKIEIAGAHDDVLEALLSGWWTASATLLLRREAVCRSGGWDETLEAAQDRDFFISIALTGAAIVYQPGCFSIYRRHGAGSVSTGNRPRWLHSHERVLEKAEAALRLSGRLSAGYQEALAKSYFHLARNYYDFDRSEYERLLQKALALSAGFRPQESSAYNVVQRLFGFEVAERLASYKRQVRRLTVDRGERSDFPRRPT